MHLNENYSQEWIHRRVTLIVVVAGKTTCEQKMILELCQSILTVLETEKLLEDLVKDSPFSFELHNHPTPGMKIFEF